MTCIDILLKAAIFHRLLKRRAFFVIDRFCYSILSSSSRVQWCLQFREQKETIRFPFRDAAPLPAGFAPGAEVAEL